VFSKLDLRLIGVGTGTLAPVEFLGGTLGKVSCVLIKISSLFGSLEDSPRRLSRVMTLSVYSSDLYNKASLIVLCPP
jgi:hypothetical protein